MDSKRKNAKGRSGVLSRRYLLAAVVGAAALAPVLGFANKTASERPNILFIMSDDHAAHALNRRH